MNKKESLKVCFFTGSQNLRGGTERACSDVSNLLLGSASNIVILSQFSGLNSGYPVSDEVCLAQLFEKRPEGTLGALSTMLKLFLNVRKNRPDIIVLVESISFLYVLPLFFLIKRPVLINWEHFNAQTTLGRRSRKLARWLASHLADRIVVLSDADNEIWRRQYPTSERKLVRIFNLNPYGANLNLPIRDPIKKGRPNRVLAAGRLTEQKGFDLLLDAWATIPDDMRTGWELRIVGEGEDRPLLQEKIEKLGLGSEVQLEGHSDNMADEFSESDLFVLSSRFEGFGLVVVEALSFGLPVISFNCVAGPGEILTHNFNGKLVPPENVDSLAEALAELMVNESLRHQMSKNTPVGLERFSQSEVRHQWLSLIDSVSNARG
jgi:glycosyltransferase involved in cell wall biosynthesis